MLIKYLVELKRYIERRMLVVKNNIIEDTPSPSLLTRFPSILFRVSDAEGIPGNCAVNQIHQESVMFESALS